MCIGDWRLGRLIRINAFANTPGIGGTLTIPRNSQRVGLRIGHAGTIAVATSNPSIAVDGAVIDALTVAQRFRCFTLANDGDLPSRVWTITTPNVATVLGIVEFFMPEKYLAAALEEFERSLRL